VPPEEVRAQVPEPERDAAGRPLPETLLFGRRRERIDQVVAQRTRSFTLVLERVGDPHNVAAILRSCEAFGVQDVHVVEHEKHGTRMNAKITQGCDKWLDLHFHKSIATCAAELKAQGFAFCVSDLADGAEPYGALPLEGKLAVVVGNEQDGISDETRALADRRFVIPMHGFSQSFNVSVTAAICLALMRERRREKGMAGDLPEGEQAALRRRFYELAVKQGGRIYTEE
jgi:tRNA (guanosine-2'-O-)-methyltransferase